ncbi:MAG: hypothetical protein N2Z82_07085 [Thermomicrobium sp.]|nr:hypothetical protein [Thermomicrobium sp.]
MLAAALGALRHMVANGSDAQDRAALEEARQRLWLSVPLESELAWWIAPEVAAHELVPLLRSLATRAPLAERARAERVLRRVSERLEGAGRDGVRLRTRLDDLVWLAERARRANGLGRLRSILERLVDPHLEARLIGDAARWEQAARGSSDGARTHGVLSGERRRDAIGSASLHRASSHRSGAESSRRPSTPSRGPSESR